MKISVYTCCNNAIENEFTLFEGMMQALRFCDEFVYVDGGSTDGTLEKMEEFVERDSRIKIYENPWEKRIRKAMTMIQKNIALSHCSGDWCFLMDADEVYSDSFCLTVRKLLENIGNEFIAIYIPTYHFYGRFDTICLRDPLLGHSYYKGKIYGVRNGLGIHHGNADGDHDGFVDNNDVSLKKENTCVLQDSGYVCHFGHVRSNEKYLIKKNDIERRYYIDWKDLERWDFEKILKERSDCFEKIDISLIPSIMTKRVMETTNEKGFVVHDKVLSYYKRFLGGRNGEDK